MFRFIIGLSYYYLIQSIFIKKMPGHYLVIKVELIVINIGNFCTDVIRVKFIITGFYKFLLMGMYIA